MSMNRTEKEQVRVHIRWMIRRDMPEVLQTEQESFEFAWTEEDFLCCLRQRNCIGMVAEHDDQVVGFMIYELNKNRIQVLNFAVAGMSAAAIRAPPGAETGDGGLDSNDTRGERGWRPPRARHARRAARRRAPLPPPA